MADYPGQERSELNRLQQEAIRRAREMQSRAQIPSARQQPAPQAPRETEAPPPPPPPPPPQPRQRQRQRQQPDSVPAPDPREDPAPSPPPQAPPSPPAGSFFGGVSGSLDFLLKDPERSMLLMLLLILMEEKADTSLIFALLYLLI